MAFIITREGEKIPVPIEVDYFDNPCPLYHDNATLQKCYLLNLYKKWDPWIETEREEGGKKVQELVAQVKFVDKLPTNEQIMYQMWKHGLSRFDIATIEEGYTLEWDEKDWEESSQE
jgi:hypothetical protein